MCIKMEVKYCGQMGVMEVVILELEVLGGPVHMKSRESLVVDKQLDQGAQPLHQLLQMQAMEAQVEIVEILVIQDIQDIQETLVRLLYLITKII